MKLNCLIVDDEPIARKGLSEDVGEFDFLNVCGLAEDAFQALQFLNETETIDLIFLDINMPGLSGLDFLKLVRVKPLVIITTAYQQFAINGYELGVIDYLLKPIPFKRLEMAVNKARELFELKKQQIPGNPGNDFLYVKCNGEYEKIFFCNILYVEAANNYVFIHTNEKKFMTYMTMKGMEGQLPAELFVRTHKSYLVSRNHIDKIAGSDIIIQNTKLPVSRSFKDSFQKTVAQNKLLRRV
jgi:two-component system LytT family response regulator